MSRGRSSNSLLEALLPGYMAHVEPQLASSSSTESSNMPSVSECSPPPDGAWSSEEEIDYLSRLVFQIGRNEPRPPWLERHISSAFRADFDNFPNSQTWKEHIETFRIIHRADPGFLPEIINLVVDVSEHNTHADAFLLVQTIGRPENLRRHSTARLKWRRRDGRWEVYHIWGMRAPFATFDNI